MVEAGHLGRVEKADIANLECAASHQLREVHKAVIPASPIRAKQLDGTGVHHAYLSKHMICPFGRNNSGRLAASLTTEKLLA